MECLDEAVKDICEGKCEYYEVRATISNLELNFSNLSLNPSVNTKTIWPESPNFRTYDLHKKLKTARFSWSFRPFVLKLLT